ncbi:acyl-CoA dehydrogenase family protein [Pseudomonas fluorescens]|uniref:acyl-CoA dehydrogenase family protein n=1 Tax=Pseudomonas fluorescens TaxID=294 RepID=UPI001160FA93|nr:acyl-CoA dehydrogenase [Pseudomonas fluorescens]
MSRLNESELVRLFDDKTASKVIECFNALDGTPDFHSPIVWRSTIPELCRLDCARTRRGIDAHGAAQMVNLFRFFGGLSLDLRDVPGLGHGRLLSLAKGQAFEAFLRDVASGESFAAICITEASGGSDLHSLQTTAVRCEGGYTLTGCKHYVARLRQANLYVVFANVAGLDRSLSVFLVPASADGIVVHDIPALGLQGRSWGALELNQVFVPKQHRVGGEGQGFSLFSTHFSYWRCAMAAAAIGAAQATLDRCKERLQHRQAFDGPIGRFTHLQQGYAQHAARLHMAWLLVQSTALRLDKQAYCYIDAAMAKAESVEIAIAAAQWAMLIHGAEGCCVSTGLEKNLRDLLGLRIADGTPDVLRGQVARGLLGETLYSLSLGRQAVSPKWSRERQLW